MMEGVFGFNSLRKEIRSGFLELRRQSLLFRRNAAISKYEMTKYMFDNKEVDKASFLVACIWVTLLPIKYNLLLWIYSIKTTINIGLETAGSSIGIAGVASVVMISAATNKHHDAAAAISTNSEIVQKEEGIVSLLGRKVDPVVHKDPVFKPMFATVIMMSGQHLECKIINFTVEYIEVLVGEEKRIISQKDIYEIRSI